MNARNIALAGLLTVGCDGSDRSEAKMPPEKYHPDISLASSKVCSDTAENVHYSICINLRGEVQPIAGRFSIDGRYKPVPGEFKPENTVVQKDFVLVPPNSHALSPHCVEGDVDVSHLSPISIVNTCIWFDEPNLKNPRCAIESAANIAAGIPPCTNETK